MKPTSDDILNLVKRQLGLRNVRLEDDIAADLGAVSADVINIVAALEDLFGIVIGEDDEDHAGRNHHPQSGSAGNGPGAEFGVILKLLHLG